MTDKESKKLKSNPDHKSPLLPQQANLDVNDLLRSYSKRVLVTREIRGHRNARTASGDTELDSIKHSAFREIIVNYKLKSPFTVSIFGACYLGGQPIQGVEKAADEIRAVGLAESIYRLGWSVQDKGNVIMSGLTNETDPPVNGVNASLRVSEGTHQTHNAVRTAAEAGHFPLTLGGDHSCAIGTISGLCAVYPNLGVIWVDAHADLNTPQISPSGNIHGMPLGFLLGLADHETLPGFKDWFSGCLDPSSIVYIGLRDVDFVEKKVLRQLGIKAFSMHHVDKYGIGKIMEMALDHLDPRRQRPIHLSFDVDGMDPQFCPSTGTPVMGGLSFREACYICECVSDTGNLVGMDLVEVNPTLGTEEQKKLTVDVAVGLIKSALGQQLI